MALNIFCFDFQVIVGLLDGNQPLKKSPFSKLMETGLTLETTAEEPVYDSRFEFRDYAYDAYSKLVFMVTIHCFIEIYNSEYFIKLRF